MSTKIVATTWVCLCCMLYAITDIKIQAQDSTSFTYQSQSVTLGRDTIPTKDVIDSAKIIRDQFVAQKEDLKNNVQVLQEKQKKIRKTQRQIDSVTVAMTNPYCCGCH